MKKVLKNLSVAIALVCVSVTALVAVPAESLHLGNIQARAASKVEIAGHMTFPMNEEVKTVKSDYRRALKSANGTVSAVSHGYYYEKLSDEIRKNLYDGIYYASASGKRLSYGTRFPNELSESEVAAKGYLFYTGNSSRKSEYNTLSVLNESIEAICYDHMTNIEYYMCEPKVYEFVSNGTYRDYVVMKAMTNDNYESMNSAIKANVNSCVSEIRKEGLVDSNNIGKTIIRIHDWYTQKISYGYSDAPRTNDEAYYNTAHTAYSALVEEKAVCDGYAQGYALILKELGIDCKVVTGTAYDKSLYAGGHAWNMVYLDGQWYEEDTTWADTESTEILYDFFNRTTEDYASYNMKKRHVREAPFGGRLIDKAYGTYYTYDLLKEYSLDALTETSVANTYVNPVETLDAGVKADSVVRVHSIGENKAIDPLSGATYDLQGKEAHLSGLVYENSSIKVADVVYVDSDAYPVTEISEKAFNGNSGLLGISGGGNLKKIGARAFRNCKNLKNVDLSAAKISRIGSKAFYGCKKLRKLRLNGNMITKVGSKAFCNLNSKATVFIMASNKKKYKNIVKKLKSAGTSEVSFKRLK
ncbi:MAG: leucine-rich repeat protein [Butyrivibrio sp.]|nr:leucine-rich repeat protein [Butyrivibrio sp.]